jgi:hypothetical protein
MPPVVERSSITMGRSGDDGFVSDVLIAVVYASGVIVWAVQPHWLTRQPLLRGLFVTFAVSGVLGVLSGRWRSLAAPLLFGLVVGATSAATVNGDLGRAGEFAIAVVWGLALGAAMAAGILIRHQI